MLAACWAVVELRRNWSRRQPSSRFYPVKRPTRKSSMGDPHRKWSRVPSWLRRKGKERGKVKGKGAATRTRKERKKNAGKSRISPCRWRSPPVLANRGLRAARRAPVVVSLHGGPIRVITPTRHGAPIRRLGGLIRIVAPTRHDARVRRLGRVHRGTPTRRGVLIRRIVDRAATRRAVILRIGTPQEAATHRDAIRRDAARQVARREDATRQGARLRPADEIRRWKGTFLFSSRSALKRRTT